MIRLDKKTCDYALLFSILLLGILNKSFAYSPPCNEQGRNFSGADLRLRKFDYCLLQNANLSRVNASGASFYESRFDNANMSESIFNRAYFRDSILVGSDFSGSQIMEADLMGVNLTQANFSRTDLRYSNLSFSVVNETDLRGADLRGARLWSWTDPNGTVQFQGAKFNDETSLPWGKEEALKRGMIYVP